MWQNIQKNKEIRIKFNYVLKYNLVNYKYPDNSSTD